jgi:hypothetical protein
MASMHLIADQDRDRASASLRRHYLLGRLTSEELSERIELALRARNDGELRTALDGLPAPWHPHELVPAAEAAVRAAKRVLVSFALAALWAAVSFVLLIAFLVAVATDASTATQLTVLLVWVAVTYVVWRSRRRPARSARP